MREDSLIEQVINHYGVNAQLMIIIEENGELNHEILKAFRGGFTVERLNRIMEEAADARIAQKQIPYLLERLGVKDADERIRRFEYEKELRLADRIRSEREAGTNQHA